MKFISLSRELASLGGLPEVAVRRTGNSFGDQILELLVYGPSEGKNHNGKPVTYYGYNTIAEITNVEGEHMDLKQMKAWAKEMIGILEGLESTKADK